MTEIYKKGYVTHKRLAHIKNVINFNTIGLNIGRLQITRLINTNTYIDGV